MFESKGKAPLHQRFVPILVFVPAALVLSFLAVTYKNPKTTSTNGSFVFSLNNIRHGISSKFWAEDRSATVQKVWELAEAMTPEEAAKVNNEQLYSMFPETYNCDKNFFRRIGGEGDGGKWSCGEFFKPKEGNCVAISLGSNGQFEFEESILAHTKNNCTIYTFDCTGTWTPPNPQIKFHPWCLGNDGVFNSRIYKSWESITNDLGLTHVDFFKIDIEGFEWVAMPSVLEHWNLKVMPKQISIEMHMWPQPEGVPEHYQTTTTPSGIDYLHSAINFFRAFYKAGYQVAAAEYNPLSTNHCCQEFTFVRSSE
ncbi:UNVERIFIED_CONTAM: hypothetical protein HDU68_004367 [Siphonaria sp. JEL0065]|nr:hypothetical protein HDU68_004367 [Siphonaria sp. JEL0065]